MSPVAQTEAESVAVAESVIETVAEFVIAFEWVRTMASLRVAERAGRTLGRPVALRTEQLLEATVSWGAVSVDNLPCDAQAAPQLIPLVS